MEQGGVNRADQNFLSFVTSSSTWFIIKLNSELPSSPNGLYSLSSGKNS